MLSQLVPKPPYLDSMNWPGNKADMQYDYIIKSICAAKLIKYQDTPIPGAYDLKDFVQELQGNPVRTTYGFKNAGRKKNADPSRKGTALMPGLYKHRTCVDQLGTQQKTYSFKACDRYHTPTALVGYIDKVCNLIECKLLCCLIVCNLLLAPCKRRQRYWPTLLPTLLNVTCCVHLHTLLHVVGGCCAK